MQSKSHYSFPTWSYLRQRLLRTCSMGILPFRKYYITNLLYLPAWIRNGEAGTDHSGTDDFYTLKFSHDCVYSPRPRDYVDENDVDVDITEWAYRTARQIPVWYFDKTEGTVCENWISVKERAQLKQEVCNATSVWGWSDGSTLAALTAVFSGVCCPGTVWGVSGVFSLRLRKYGLLR